MKEEDLMSCLLLTSFLQAKKCKKIVWVNIKKDFVEVDDSSSECHRQEFLLNQENGRS